MRNGPASVVLHHPSETVRFESRNECDACGGKRWGGCGCSRRESSAEESSGAPRLPARSSTEPGCPQSSALRSCIGDPRHAADHGTSRHAVAGSLHRHAHHLSLATSPYTSASHQRGHFPYTTTSSSRSTAASQSRSRHLHRGADQKRGARICAIGGDRVALGARRRISHTPRHAATREGYEVAIGYMRSNIRDELETPHA
jgi:hypothetical protein